MNHSFASRFGLCALLLAATSGTLAAQQSAALAPDDPRARRAMELLELVNSGDRDRAAAYAERHWHPNLLAQGGTGQAVDVLFSFRDSKGTEQRAELALGPQGGVQVRFRNAGAAGPAGFAVLVEPAPPHRIRGLMGLPAGDATAPVEPDPQTPAAPLDARGRQQVVDSVAKLMERAYVTPDTGRTIAARLRERLGGGAYDRLTDPEAFADALTADMRAVNGDRHLNVRAPGQGPRSGPGQRRLQPEGNGIERAERLNGNVGYLRFGMIPGEPGSFDAVADALRSLDGTDAMILDLRGVPGGSAQMSNFLISHFTPPNVHSLNVYDPALGDTLRRQTLAEVPGPRRTDVPLYVLVDGGSASAAEDIPFVLQNLGRATVVGERTAGAGRNNRLFPVGNGLVASISFTRVWDPRTGREWERTGVQPDIAVPSEQALEAALRHAAGRRTAPRGG